jgi:hypothetical protein
VSLLELTSLVKRCSGITRLRMKGVQGLAPEDAFKLAPLLPALTHYQIPTGTNAHHQMWSTTITAVTVD